MNCTIKNLKRTEEDGEAQIQEIKRAKHEDGDKQDDGDLTRDNVEESSSKIEKPEVELESEQKDAINETQKSDRDLAKSAIKSPQNEEEKKENGDQPKKDDDNNDEHSSTSKDNGLKGEEKGESFNKKQQSGFSGKIEFKTSFGFSAGKVENKQHSIQFGSSTAFQKGTAAKPAMSEAFTFGKSNVSKVDFGDLAAKAADGEKSEGNAFEKMLKTVEKDDSLNASEHLALNSNPSSRPKPVVTKTYEEDEEVLFSHRAKLFELIEGNWAERGVGVMKLNRKKDRLKYRLVMRADLTFRLVLNMPLFDGFKPISDGKFVRLTFVEPSNNETQNYALRFNSMQEAESLVEHILGLNY
ncbi:Ran-specific GTPase-activating protein 2 [Zancudomyces culisetae]|uniref:Ran-specific GTPase-activating protein 2 n=1 Tax=Zancudomyces culisetae TaxID=1213189 RepID=A0A1R1PW04_ZANCU|nr:Ran-specific GTPase-activating protein 2 [Zancudomyces culisetae]|eukprot:OMH85082.1 Ran-specific GTPase-activating protein 2 [Zancudomyces culisetae]